jgi:hypothetical protein
VKSPYRKGIQITVSNAAVQAAATVLAQVYRAGNPQMAMRIMNLASEFIDEIEARQGTPEAVIKQWADEVEAA